MSNDAPEKKPVRVTILNQTLTVLTSSDPRDVEQLARRVDELMSGIAARSPNADTVRVAILACMHLADKLSSLEAGFAGMKQRVDEKVRHFAELLDQVIDDPQQPG